MALQYELLYSKNKLLKPILEQKLMTTNKSDKQETRMRDNEKRSLQTKFELIFKSDDKLGTNYKRRNKNTSNLTRLDTDILTQEHFEYQRLVDLLFTNGELDTDKVLCLHALSSHPCETLKPPSFSPHNVRREQSTLEKLIERSRACCGYRCGINNNLPIYVLNIGPHKLKPVLSRYNHSLYSDDCCIRDGRLATRLVINDNICRLINTVLEALQHCNPQKMTNLLKIAQNPTNIREIVNKHELQAFLKSLASHKMILSSDSFILTKPFAQFTPIKIDTTSRNLEQLIQNIRGSVLCNPTKTNRYLNDVKNTHSELVYTENSAKNKKQMNIFGYQTNSFNAEKMALLLNNKMREAHERDLKKLKQTQLRNAAKYKSKESFYNELHNSETTCCCKKEKMSCRKSRCYACKEKWRENLPSNTYTNNKNKKINYIDSNFKACVSQSTHWLLLLIKEEEEKLKKMRNNSDKDRSNRLKLMESVTKKPMSLTKSNRRPGSFSRKSKDYVQDYNNTAKAYYTLNNLNLAKIKHEISVKENNKRVKKFLEEPLFGKKVVESKNLDYKIIPI